MLFNKTSAVLALALTALVLHPQASYAQGSLVIDNTWVQNYGNTVTGTYQGTNSQPALLIVTDSSHPVTVNNCSLSGPGDLISAPNGGANVTVINTSGNGTNPNSAGVAKGNFLTAYHPANIDVEHCTIQGTKFGVYVNGFSGNTSQGNTIKVLYNQVHNMDGRPSDPNSSTGYVQSGEFNGHAFQLNQVHSVPNIQIAWNQMINDPGSSQVSDNINIYQSQGVQGNPISIHDNYVQGGYPVNPARDTYSGGGIICDGSGDINTAPAWVEAFYNQVISTTNYGLSIPAGHDNSFHDNRVISSGRLPDNTFIPAQNVGAALYNQNRFPDNSDGTPNPNPNAVYFHNSMVNNLIGWAYRSNGSSNTTYFNGQDDNGVQLNTYNGQNSFWSGVPTLQDEANELRSWAQKLSGSNIAVGNNFLLNPGFETGDLSHWTLYDTVGGGTTFPENLGTGVEHSGTYHLAMWHGTAYEAYASQIATGYQGASLPPGTYTASAWVQSTGVNSGNGDAVEMYVYQYDASGGGYMAVPVPTTGASSNDWRQVTIPNIPVSGGKCEVGFHIKDSAGNHWLRADDVQLYDPLVKPGVPTDMKAVAGASGTKKITLNWNKVASATSYKVYRASSSGGTYSQVGTSTTLSYGNTGLTAGTTYYYKVAATNAAGTSGQSASVSAKAQ